MAINPETQYPGKITPSSPSYPYGAARNITVPGDGTGTPWEAALVNDLFGFQQALLSEAGVVPSGSPETAEASQYLTSLTALFPGSFPTLDDALNATYLAVVSKVVVLERFSGYGGGVSKWTLITKGTTPKVDLPNGFDIVEYTANPTLALKLEIGPVANAIHFGMLPDGSTDNTPVLVEMAERMQVDLQFSAIYFPKGDFYFEPVGGTTTCLQWAADAVEFQEKPISLTLFGDGSESRIIVDNAGANNVWMAGPAADVVNNIYVFGLGFLSKSIYDSPTDRQTYRNNYITMPNYARIFNVGRMWRSFFTDCHFEYVQGFFTNDAGEDSNNNFTQQNYIARNRSTQHQSYWLDVNQMWSCDIIENTLESGNGCLKIGRSNAQSAYGLRILRNTMQGNGTIYCGIRMNYGSSIEIVGNYFESNREAAGKATPAIFMNNNTTESSIVIDGNFFAQQLSEIDGFGADFYHVRLDEVKDTMLVRGNTFTGGNGFDFYGTSDGDFVGLNNKFEPVGSIYNEGILAGPGPNSTDELIRFTKPTTWAPVVSDAAVGGNLAAITVNDPVYQRIGNMVIISAQILNIDTTGMTPGNSIYIQGLPLTAAAIGLAQGSCVLEQVTFTDMVTPQIGAGADVITLRQSTSAGNDLNVPVSAINSGSGDIQFTISYFID